MRGVFSRDGLTMEKKEVGITLNLLTYYEFHGELFVVLAFDFNRSQPCKS